ncbi:protein translocase subunit SecD [Anderseniella sp. Alg231-50]|uniref:protein translocase subunit SecD n=1 Tax=Anderseniella sp. Alg231-50 TaxID=1922226 RepID=UPI000D55729E
MLHFSKLKAFVVIGIVLLAGLMAMPNLLAEKSREALPNFMPSQALTLGLDLQGGSHILLEVDVPSLKDTLEKQLVGDVRLRLRDAKIRYANLKRTGNGASVTISEPARAEEGFTILQGLSQPLDTGLFGQGVQVQEFDVVRNGQNVRLTFSEGGLQTRIGRAVQQSIEVLGVRINELGTTEPTIQQQGTDRILVQVPGLQDPERLKDLLGKTALLQFRLLCDNQPQGAGGQVPLGCEEIPETFDEDKGETPSIFYWVQTSRSATVDGEDLNDAQTGFDQRTNEPIVNFRFNTAGAQRFCRLTQNNVGRPFAIVLDTKVVSAPRINEQICGGSGQISGDFSTQEANDLAIVLRSGALPAKLTIVEERTVGPSLGSDSVEAGFRASIIGLIGVLIFMVISYGLFGLFAVLALVANLTMILGTLSFLGATLTLPGIAGIVLTMGMAVDANVLVFERIREEVANGRSPLNAIETGFRMALATILDANITTLIAAVILFGMGSGPVRGFAVTLGIGILATVFTAYTVTQLIISGWIKLSRPKTVPL